MGSKQEESKKLELTIHGSLTCGSFTMQVSNTVVLDGEDLKCNSSFQQKCFGQVK